MVPTAFGVIGPSNFQRYLWLRSPYTSGRGSAYIVGPSGDGSGYGYIVGYSYGRI